MWCPYQDKLAGRVVTSNSATQMKRVPTSFFPPVALDPTKKTPMYRQLYDWMRDAIVSGQLRPGQRVPSTRALAAELNISRLPVLSAFEQLHAEGYLQMLVGSGTIVSRSVPDDATRPTTSSRKAPARQKSPRKISRLGATALSRPPQLCLNSLGLFLVTRRARIWNAKHLRLLWRNEAKCVGGNIVVLNGLFNTRHMAGYTLATGSSWRALRSEVALATPSTIQARAISSWRFIV